MFLGVEEAQDAVCFHRCELALLFKTKDGNGSKKKGGADNILSQKGTSNKLSQSGRQAEAAGISLSTIRSLAGDFLQNFTVMFSQLQDFPMLNSKVFALQMLCLMKEVDPVTFSKSLTQLKAQSIAGCCVFDNDYHFYVLTEVVR